MLAQIGMWQDWIELRNSLGLLNNSFNTPYIRGFPKSISQSLYFLLQILWFKKHIPRAYNGPDIQWLICGGVNRPGWMVQLGRALQGHNMQKSLRERANVCSCNTDFSASASHSFTHPSTVTHEMCHSKETCKSSDSKENPKSILLPTFHTSLSTSESSSQGAWSWKLSISFVKTLYPGWAPRAL